MKARGFGASRAAGYGPETLEIDLHWIDEHIGGKPYGVDPIAPGSVATTEDTTPQDTLDIVRDEHLVFVRSILAAAQHRHQRSLPQPVGGGGLLTNGRATNIIDVPSRTRSGSSPTPAACRRTTCSTTFPVDRLI